MYDECLNKIISASVKQLHLDLQTSGPTIAQQVSSWLKTLTQDGDLEAMVKHPWSFPVVLLPWWLEETVTPSHDPAFHTDLAYSSINGYLAVRLVDNLMDGDASASVKMLPALFFFTTQSQSPYWGHFPGSHRFWELLRNVWLGSAELTLRDGELLSVDHEQFLQVSGKKSSGAKVPVIATALRYGREDLIASWSEFIDLLSCWQQMRNDTRDWLKDWRNDNTTYFLSEAALRKDPTESVPEWVERDGFDWATALLLTWLEQLRELAKPLGSRPLLGYLDMREADVLTWAGEQRSDLGKMMEFFRAVAAHLDE